MRWVVVVSIAVGFGLAALLDCGGIPKPPSGSSLCVDMTDAGPQASVSAGGITVTMPLKLMKFAADAGE